MVSEHVTKACKIFKVMAMISPSLVFKAATQHYTAWLLTLDGDNELRDHGQHLGASLFQHIENALHCQKSVWVLLLTDALEKDGQVVMVV